MKMTLILVDPVLKKEVDVVLYLEPEEALGVVELNPIILKNIKTVVAEEGTLSLRSCFNSNYLIKFNEEEEITKYLKPFVGKELDKD